MLAKIFFLENSGSKYVLAKNHSITRPPPIPFQVKRSVPKAYSKVFEITVVAIRMESYHIVSFAVQVIIISLSKSNNNSFDATNNI